MQSEGRPLWVGEGTAGAELVATALEVMRRCFCRCETLSIVLLDAVRVAYNDVAAIGTDRRVVADELAVVDALEACDACAIIAWDNLLAIITCTVMPRISIFSGRGIVGATRYRRVSDRTSLAAAMRADAWLPTSAAAAASVLIN